MSIEVKICGITNLGDALSALEFGADYLGFILYPESPRAITVKALVQLLAGVGKDCRAIGVFVNERRDEVEKTAADCGLFAVQVHGDENAAEFVDFPIPVWRAVKQVSGSWFPKPSEWTAERYVVDSSIAGMYGGTGVTGDWDKAAGFAKRYPVMLSGGLTADNVREAIRLVKPKGVDVASGVEASPGKKDFQKLKAFMENARAVKI